MKLKRLVSAVLAVGMALTMLPTAAFADNSIQWREIDSIKIIPETGYVDVTADGVVGGGDKGAYKHFTSDKVQEWAANANANPTTGANYCAIKKGFSYGGAGSTVIRATINVEGGKLTGGIYAGSVGLKEVDGVQAEIEGGIFAKPIAGVTMNTLTATGLEICGGISDTAYTVGVQHITVSTLAERFGQWYVNGVKLEDSTELANVENEIIGKMQVLSFDMPEKDITITADRAVIPFQIGESGLPEYDGELYEGSTADGWKFDSTNNKLTVYEGATVDLGNHCVDWAISNYGTLKNGITPGNVVNRQNEDGTYGRVENIAFKMNVNFGDQDTNITWLTVKNAVVNDVFPDIVGVIGTQTLTVKATVSPFDGWSYSGTVSEDVAKQIEAQKNNENLTLTLTGEEGKADTIALTAKTTGDTFDMTLVDGTASVDGKEVTATQKGQTVTLTAADAPEGMVFDRWEITPADVALTLEEGGFDSHAATASFKMPAQTLSIRAMYRMADQPEEPDVLGTVAVVATVGVGAAVVGYTGYMIGTELYLNAVLPEGVAIPQNTAELAKLVWTDAGKPAPAAVMAADATDEQKALTWAAESQLISADKAADASVGRWEVIDAWNKAQEMKK